LHSDADWLFYFKKMAKLKILNKYATVPNELLNDSVISLKAKGMYAYIQSKPENWDFSAERISKQLKEGLPSVKSALQELELNGYLVRRRFQNNKGFWEVEYILNENPTIQNPTAENLIVGKPTQENPTIGKPTNISNKDSSNKDYNSNKEYKENGFDNFFGSKEITLREEIFNKWFQHKKEKKQSYTPSGKKELLKTWENKSDYELELAINHSISNNYSGIFENKNLNNNGNTTEKLGTSAARMEALRKW